MHPDIIYKITVSNALLENSFTINCHPQVLKDIVSGLIYSGYKVTCESIKKQ